jgi:hypothetical protein
LMSRRHFPRRSFALACGSWRPEESWKGLSI